MAKNLILCFSVIVITFFSALNVAANDNIKVILNDREIIFDQPPIIEDGRTLVPVRAIFEAIGANVNYNEESKIIVASCEDFTITMQVDTPVFSVDNNVMINNESLVVNYEFDVPPKIINGRTLVPVGFIFKSINYDVDWNESAKIVYLKKGETLETLQSIESQGNGNLETTKIFNIGDTITLAMDINDPKARFTINSVKETDERNNYNKTNPDQVIIINYTYENIGFDDLVVWHDNFTVIDADNNVCSIYPVNTIYPQTIPKGTKFTAEAAYGIIKQSNNLTLLVDINARLNGFNANISTRTYNLVLTDVLNMSSSSSGLTAKEAEVVSKLLEIQFHINRNIKSALEDYLVYDFNSGAEKFNEIKDICNNLNTVQLVGKLSTLYPYINNYCNTIIKSCDKYIEYGKNQKGSDIMDATDLVIEAGKISDDFFEAAKMLDPEKWK